MGKFSNKTEEMNELRLYREIMVYHIAETRHYYHSKERNLSICAVYGRCVHLYNGVGERGGWKLQ